MNVIILEDEFIASKRLQRLIKEVDDSIHIVSTFTSIQDTAEYLITVEEQPDMMFVDIHVVDGNSLESFNLVEIESKVVFITAYDEYAVNAFRLNATDYLLKPIKRNELKEAIEKAEPKQAADLPTLQEEQYKSRFLVKFNAKLYNVKPEDIAYIFSHNKVSYFYLKDGSRIPSDFGLHELMDKLNPALFFRANRQFIIHIDSVAEMKTHSASRLKLTLLPDINQSVVISTERTRLFKNWLG